jgi:subtilisin family serine protease
MKKRGQLIFLTGAICSIGVVIGLLWLNDFDSGATGDQTVPARTLASASERSAQEVSSPVVGRAPVRDYLLSNKNLYVSEPEETGDSWLRVRIVQKGGTYPFVRIEEDMARDPESGAPIVIARRFMLADHVGLSVPDSGDELAVREAIESVGFSVARAYPFSPVWQIALGRHDPDAVPEALAAIATVLPDLVVEPDLLYFPDAIPDDLDLVKMWGLKKIGAEVAWEVSKGSGEAVVGIIDSGADINHPDLAANIWVNPGEIAGNGVDDDGNGLVDDIHGWNFDGDNNSLDDQGRHGTHVAGTVGAVGNNTTGLVGVNWNVSMIVARAGDSTFANTALANAVDYVTDLKKAGVNVVATNNSYGGESASSIMEARISDSLDQGILFVAAAGNDESNNDVFPSYPANYTLENIISVASSNLADQLSIFSNYGRTSVDLAAPGSAIRSTIPGASYGYLSGTSMASPHVAGALALLHSSEPDLSWLELRDRILASVDRVPVLFNRVATGGRLNLRRALGVTGDLATARIEVPATPVVVLEPAIRAFGLVGSMGVVDTEASIAWSSVSGPAAAQFSSPGELKTEATFPEDGLYRIRLTIVSPLRSTFDEITVVVGPEAPATESLAGFWRFEEAGGNQATDSSGQGRTGTLSGVVRETGLVGKAARFDGQSSVMSYASAPTDRITISAWVRSDTLGEFVFPRIMDTPDFIFYFGRRTGDVDADINSIKFYAFKTEQDGIWHTANDTIGDNEWLHVAVSYDGRNEDNFPLVFLDGEVLAVGVDARSGDQARGVVGDQNQTPGTAYIGENADGERAWDGLIDEVRLYTRALERKEVAWIAAEHDAESVLELPLQTLAVPGVGQTLSVGLPAGSAPAGALYSWTIAGDSDTVLVGPADRSTVSVIPRTGGNHRARVTVQKGIASVVREVAFDLPYGARPTAGLFKGSTGTGGDAAEVWILVDEVGRATILGPDGDTGHPREGGAIEIGPNGVFGWADADGTTYSGQFDQSAFTGVSTDGATVIQGARTSDDPNLVVKLNGPIVGTADGRVSVVVGSDAQMLLVVSGTGQDVSLTGRVSDGSFELSDPAGRIFSGSIELIDSVAWGVIDNGSEQVDFVLTGSDSLPDERLANISTRGVIGVGGEVMIAGLVVEGAATSRVLVRGVGPGLSQFELTGFASATELVLRNGNLDIGYNRGWRSDPQTPDLQGIFDDVGAFPLLSDLGDSALVADLEPGVYTAALRNPDEAGGIGLLEVYDSLNADQVRLVNLSTRGVAGLGDRALIAGFVLNEMVPRRVLVRAIGPGLDGFSVQGRMDDPEITLFADDVAIANNDNWNSSPDSELIESLGEAVGAFALSEDSADAALVRYLGPGRFTVQLEPADGQEGIALVEIYMIPEAE